MMMEVWKDPVARTVILPPSKMKVSHNVLLKARIPGHSQVETRGVLPALKVALPGHLPPRARNQVLSQVDNKGVLPPLKVAHPGRLPQMASRPVQILPGMGPAALYPYLKMWVTVVMMILYYVRFVKQP